MPVAATVLALGEIGVMSHELGDLVRGRLGVGGDAYPQAGSGQLLRVWLPVEGHRVATLASRGRCAIVSSLGRLLENVCRARVRERGV